MTEATVVATRKVLTTEEKIAQLKARIAKDTAALDVLVNGAAIAAAFANVKSGDTVTFTLGRAETKRTLSGSVIARGDVGGKDVVKVIAGEGLATAVYQVEVAKLDSVGAVPVEPTAEQVAEANAEEEDLLAGLSPEHEAQLNAVVL